MRPDLVARQGKKRANARKRAQILSRGAARRAIVVVHACSALSGNFPPRIQFADMHDAVD